MGGSKPSVLAKLPRGQRSQFLLGPVSSWFMPNISDIWTQQASKIDLNKEAEDLDDDNFEKLVICCSQDSEIDAKISSYYAYGSIGCFCYGQIETHKLCDNNANQFDTMNLNQRMNSYSADINHLIDIKEDNSKVTCLRFNKVSSKPFVMILTENGTLLIHDCLNIENIIHYRKNELVNKLIGDKVNQSDDQLLQLKEYQPPSKKRPRMVVYQQINAFVWPHMKHAFLGISLLKERKNTLIWVKMKDLTNSRQANGHYTINKTDLIESHDILDLNLEENKTNPICCMESSNLNDDVNCTIAVAMDDGLIVVVNIDFKNGQSNRVIKLTRHSDQICSLSLYTGDMEKYPMGLLASMSRGGLALVWDIDNEMFFADYHGSPQEGAPGSKKDCKINWFSACFLSLPGLQRVYLAVTNSLSGISVLEIPEKVKASKVRLSEVGKSNQKRSNNKNNNNNRNNKQLQKSLFDNCNDQSMSHHALIFNLIFDPISGIISTCSLDGNHIIWSCKQQAWQSDNNNSKNLKSNSNSSCEDKSIQLPILRAEYLIPNMQNHARTHTIRFNPIREELLGLALGKAGLRFYSVPKNSMSRRFNMTTSHNLIVRQVAKCNIQPTSLAWNPAQEYRLAIGTIDGRVLRADLMPRKSNLIEARREELPRVMVKSTTSASRLFESDPDSDQGDLFDVEYRPVDRIEDTAETATKTTFDTSALHNQKKPHQGATSTRSASATDDNSDKTDAIYSLCWGPNPHQPNDLTRSAIYAVAIMSHRLFIYYSKKENSEKLTDYLCEYEHTRELNRHIRLSEFAGLPEARDQATKVMWKSSMDLMALGTISGNIIISSYSTNCDMTKKNTDENVHSVFQRLAVVDVANSYIQCLAWHPNTDKENDNYYYLACSSNESPVLIYNLKNKCHLIKMQVADTSCDVSEHNDDSCSLDDDIKPIFSLNGHKKAVSDIAWNPHEQNQLATCSYDRNCFVWHLCEEAASLSSTSVVGESGDDASNKIVSKFSARDRLFTLEWSLDDEDLILTSGNDSTIWAWRPSENANVNSNLGPQQDVVSPPLTDIRTAQQVAAGTAAAAKTDESYTGA